MVVFLFKIFGYKKCKNVKGQTNFFDFIIGFFVFSFIIFLFFSAYNSNYYSERDFSYISNIVLSEGVPSDWNESFYFKPGILSDNFSIDENKLFMFYNLSKKGVLKNIFKHDFLFFVFKHNESNFSDIVIINFSNGVDSFDFISSDYNFSPSNVSFNDNVKVEERFVSFNNSLYIIKFLFWD